MRRSVLRGTHLLLFATVLSTPVLAADAPTPAQLQVSAHDAEAAAQVLTWNHGVFRVNERALLPAMREPVAQLIRAHAERLRGLMPAWIAEERAATKNPELKGDDLRDALVVRSINEMALQAVESLGSAHDEAWSKAASATTACFYQGGSFFQRRIAVIQAAPLDLQPALLAAEAELLSHWGTRRRDVAPRPAREDLLAADFAVTRLRAGLPVSALPMTPTLAGQVFGLDRKPGRSDVWEQCNKSQWWLQSQLSEGTVDRKQALTVYRYATMPNIEDLLPDHLKPKAGTADPAAFPPIAGVYRIRGATTLRVSIDEQGKLLKVDIVARQVRGPGLHDDRPVAFEAVFDDASIALANKKSYPVGKAMDARFVAEWRFEGKSVDDQ